MASSCLLTCQSPSVLSSTRKRTYTKMATSDIFKRRTRVNIYSKNAIKADSYTTESRSGGGRN